MGKHLSLTDQAIIEKYLARDMTFAYIARRLNRSASTVAQEVKNHRCFVNGERHVHNDCLNYRSCIRRNICDTETRFTCFQRCKLCKEYCCHDLCSNYESVNCELLDRPP